MVDLEDLRKETILPRVFDELGWVKIEVRSNCLEILASPSSLRRIWLVRYLRPLDHILAVRPATI